VERHPGIVWLSRFWRENDRVLIARFIFLRGLALIFLSAFGSLAAQIHALVGPTGILPARNLLEAVARARPGIYGKWSVPTLFWLGDGDAALTAVVVLGLIASLSLFANVLPRASSLVCTICFLSFVSVARDFAYYQSDGMLLEAGAFAFFFAPPGLRPGLGASSPPSYASWMLLVWEWFRIYFESGVAKIASGDPTWRDLTAMDGYYERGPLPTWLAWHAHQLPHAVHALSVILTFVVEIPLPLAALIVRRARAPIVLFLGVFQLGIALTANYCFINYLVLILGILLLDDGVLSRLRLRIARGPNRRWPRRNWVRAIHAVFGVWILYTSLAVFALRGAPDEVSWLGFPARALAPFRLGDRYGLFAVMTPARWELEFQGSNDRITWTPYPFRYKPQDPSEPPKIFAPYQPRFEWNLWFCSLDREYESCMFAFEAGARLLRGNPYVLGLFRRDPFDGNPPRYVRIVKWQYWFTDKNERAATGRWWRREFVSDFGPLLERMPDGRIIVTFPEEEVTP